MKQLSLVIVCFLLFSCGIVISHTRIDDEYPSRHTSVDFHYYQNYGVYYNVTVGHYVVFEDGSWYIYRNRPAFLPSEAVYVRVNHPQGRPWRRHYYYREQYPPKQGHYRVKRYAPFRNWGQKRDHNTYRDQDNDRKQNNKYRNRNKDRRGRNKYKDQDKR